MRIRFLPIEQLRPFPGNPRHMLAAELEKLTRSIDEFGFVEPVVVRQQ
ncbi:MAG: ParB N-terminal domain-containing protein, partial [Gemmatimonadales bacterium]|nr:ParB N-terminal domain-containing protein [Gemmatimonadales bacterium]